MSDAVAFRPRAAYAHPDALGAVFVNDSVQIDLRELYVASADGSFLVTDPAVIAKLDQHPALKRAAVPDSAPEGAPVEEQPKRGRKGSDF